MAEGMATAAVPPLGERVEEHFRNGLCCSEALVMATVEFYAPHVPFEVAYGVSAGLCGGMGGKRATCGVFTGGAVALGLVLGRGSKQDQRIRTLSADYHQQLQQLAGAEICQQILDQMGILNWNRAGCRRLTREGSELLQSILEAELDRMGRG